VQLQLRGDALRERVAAQEIDHRIDHIHAADAVFADHLDVFQHAVLLDFDEENCARLIAHLLPGHVNGGADAAERQAKQHQPKPFANGVVIFAPVSLRRLRTGFRQDACDLLVFHARSHRGCKVPAGRNGV
jgi:hypothetical protein